MLSVLADSLIDADSDIVMEYAFARSEKRLLAPDFDPSFKEAGEAGAKIGHFVKQMPFVLSVMKILPDSAQVALNPVMASYIRLNQVSPFSSSVSRQGFMTLSMLT